MDHNEGFSLPSHHDDTSHGRRNTAVGDALFGFFMTQVQLHKYKVSTKAIMEIEQNLYLQYLRRVEPVKLVGLILQVIPTAGNGIIQKSR